MSRLQFAIALAAAFVSLQGSRTEGYSPLWGPIPAHKNLSQSVHLSPHLLRHLGTALQENRAPTRPQESGNIRWAERLPGGDLGARINAADADLGKEAGEIGVGRPGTVETQVSLSSNHVLHLHTATTWKTGIVVQNGNSVIGEGCASLITLAFSTPGPFVYGKGVSNLKVSNLCAEAPPHSAGYIW